MLGQLQIIVYFLALVAFLTVCQMYVTSHGLRRLRTPPEEGSSWPVGILVALVTVACVALVYLSERMAVAVAEKLSGF